ncbi:hypothetical protein B4O97_15985 [Marispirochaeta aestuarii]|uniref:HPr kinase/phosphorylase C-terminal domain-containing protein n=2 Tax=Marispirochaeta aestuarii TaxID=1963862 RepID=A0A1Y1RVJ7_9SPIO|nr:hypothetical protein B4O97_15985 [Marispirochaeta aestuarii]
MYYSTAFGLRIGSDIHIPEFSPTQGEPDVIMLTRELAPPPGCPEGENVRLMVPFNGGVLLHWNAIGSFLVQEGRQVTISPRHGVDEALVRLVLTGPVLGVLLIQRGWAVFHAAGVACPLTGAAVAFAAVKGEGKSTMAAAMYNAGYGMISDDLTAVSFDNEHPLVSPGFPRSKLWTESAEALTDGDDTLSMIFPGFKKMSRTVNDRFITTQAFLKAVFVLETADEIVIERLSGFKAVRALLPHWYGALFDGQLLPIFGQERYFREIANLASKVRVFRLARPRRFDVLQEVAARVDYVLSEKEECLGDGA